MLKSDGRASDVADCPPGSTLESWVLSSFLAQASHSAGLGSMPGD
jgi:hypothetical protein